MTLIVGANLEGYSIIAADTRTSWLPHYYRDGNHKIALCEFGPVTGSGYVDALLAVKNAMLKMHISHTDQFLEIIREKAIPIVNQLKKRPNFIKKDNTCFLLSYITLQNDNLLFRVALIHPQWDYQLAICERSTFVGPSDMKESDVDIYNDLLRENLQVCDPQLFKENEEAEYNANIFYNVKIISECFSKISSTSNFVSDDLDIAIFFPNYQIFYIHGLAVEIARGRMSGKMISMGNETKLLSPDLIF